MRRHRHLVTRLAFCVALVAALALPVSMALANDPTTIDVTCSSTTPLGTSTTGGITDLQDALTFGGSNPGTVVVITGFCQGSFYLPGGSAFTLEGAGAGTTDTGTGSDGLSGFTGWYQNDPGQPAPVAQDYAFLRNGKGAVDGMTLENLTFEYGVTPNNRDDSALDLSAEAGTLTLNHDTFTHNSDTDTQPEYINANPSDCVSGSPTQSTVIENSQFSNNTMTVDSGFYADGLAGAGAGLALDVGCQYDSTTLSANEFTNNLLSSDGNAPSAGGGLAIIGWDFSGVPVTQTGNTFDSNAITTQPGFDQIYGGGGEWTEGVLLQSTNDRFTRNVIPGSGGGRGFSEGAGLGVLAGQNGETCPSVYATLVQDVVADNTIEVEVSHDGYSGPTDSPGSAYGALSIDNYGYLCFQEGPRNAPADAGLRNAPADAAELTLKDSTVADNAVTDYSGTPLTSDEGSGTATAGIAGDDDTLELDNSIVYGDVGGAETTGFYTARFGPLRGTSSNAPSNVPSESGITASYSDFCDGTAPYAGTGNICADPGLVDDSYTPPTLGAGILSTNSVANSGSSSGVNAHETSSSPTVDAGSNGLVPSGLSTDIYGAIRQLAKGCPVAAGTVDIGAAEFVPTCVSTPAPSVVTTPTPTPTPSKVQPCASLRNIVMHLQYTFFLSSPSLISHSSATLTSLSNPAFGTRNLPVFGPSGSEVRLNLKTLPFGTYRVHASVTLVNGKTLHQQREWHTCRPFHWKYPPGKPRH